MKLKHSESIEANDVRETIRDIIAGYGITNPQIFGSIAIGTDTRSSDLDIAANPSASGISHSKLGQLSSELEDTLGIDVHITLTGFLSDREMNNEIKRTAVPL